MAVFVAARAQPANTYFTGDGGKGISVAILAPTSSGLAQDQSYLPALVQGEFVSNFSGYSAISVLDRERLDTINIELISPVYSDSAIAKQARQIGNLAHTTHIMGGNITKTATGYALQMHITKTDDKTAAASYSGTFTFAELDNLTGVRRASLELLRKMGVALSAKAKEELAGAAAENRVNAQTALAKGVTAYREKSEVAALSYYFQAAAFDPSLMEAVNRSSKLNANITSGSMGDNIRNDIQWRKDWVARLTEAEQFFDKFYKTEPTPYTLYYSDNIKQGDVNYKTETVNLSVGTVLFADGSWARPIERALQAVYDGLDATKRKDAWELGDWPQRGVTDLKVFSGQRQKFSVVFELLNHKNKVIGKQTLETGCSLKFEKWSHGGRRSVQITPEKKTLTFQNVSANDIADKMIIRVASVDGEPAAAAAKNGVLQIRVFTKAVTKGAGLKDSRDGKSYRTVKIGGQTWMAENLNYQTTGNSRCFRNDTSNCAKYGRMYNWNDAVSACPAGWRLPTITDWNNLVSLVGIIDGENTVGTKLKSKTGWSGYEGIPAAGVPAGTDDFGFSALPGGFNTDRMGSSGYWWSSTDDKDNSALGRKMEYSFEKVDWENVFKTNFFSVRCMRD